jgi:hypothetical protein
MRRDRLIAEDDYLLLASFSRSTIALDLFRLKADQLSSIQTI